MKQSYYDFTGSRDFFSVMNCIMERRAKRERAARVRKVRCWMLRKTVKDVLHNRLFSATAAIWFLVVTQWFWLHVVLPGMKA